MGRLEVRNQLEEAVNSFRSSLSDYEGAFTTPSEFVKNMQETIDSDEEYPDWGVDQYQESLEQVERQSREFQEFVQERCQEEKAESNRQEVRGRLEKAVRELESALKEFDNSECPQAEVVSEFLAKIGELMERDDYPEWPVDKYQSCLSHVQKQARQLDQWVSHLSELKRKRQEQKSQQERCRQSYRQPRNAFDDSFERAFFGQAGRGRYRQPTFSDLFWLYLLNFV